MKPFEPRRILVPTDFSDVADRAIEVAHGIASKFGAELTLLYADTFLPPPYFTSGHVVDVAATLDQSKELAREQLRKYAVERVGTDVNTSSEVVEDTPANGIVAYAREHAIDLVVMGTHGRSGMSRVMLGSVAERVLREIEVPLLTVRPSTPADGAIQRIVCPVNFTEVAHDALEHALSLARRFDAKLELLHLVEDSHRDLAADEMQKICEWVPKEQIAKCHLEELASGGDPAEAILRYASGADLLVIGAQHRRFTDTTVLGATSVRIVRHSPAAVLTVIRKEQAKEAAA